MGVLLTACCVAAQDVPLTTAKELLALEPGAGGPKPAVRLRGVVTYFKGAGFPDLVVQDATGGVFVSGAEGKVPAGLRTGAVVEIEGVCNARGNSFTPRVEMESARIAGAAALPAPVPAGMDELRSGRLDCQRIEKRQIKVVEAIADGDPNRQLQQVRTFITHKMDGIIMVSKDAQACIPSIKAANEAGIPIVLFNRPAADTAGVKSTAVVAYNRKLTRETVAFMIEQARKTGRMHKAMDIVGDLGDSNAIGRKEGSPNMLKIQLQP